MVERLLGRDGGEVLGGVAAERAARGGDHQRLDRSVGLRSPRHCQSAGMLAVDRQEAALGTVAGRQHQRAAGDQALLVGQGEVGAGLERRQGRRQPGDADDRVQHGVGAGVAYQPQRPTRPSSTCAAEDRPAAAAAAGSASAIVDTPWALGGGDQRLGVGGAASAQTDRSGWSRTISSAWTPIEPVAPRMATDLILRSV